MGEWKNVSVDVTVVGDMAVIHGHVQQHVWGGEHALLCERTHYLKDSSYL